MSRPKARSHVPRPVLRALLRFLEVEASSGIVLVFATIIALGWANVAPATYAALFTEPTRHFINDGLMAVFFFVVALEIKREVVAGELADRRTALLPVLAALGGMLVPAAVYLAIVGGGEASRGWGIPMATDIAFAVGILTLLGRRVNAGAKVFLLGLAIADDIGAILVIAIFYTSHISVVWLVAAFSVLALAWLSLFWGLRSLVWLVPLGFALWYATDASGIHPTIAGVALGFLTPAEPRAGETRAMLIKLEDSVTPFTAYLIVPLFALANAGLNFGDGALGITPVAMGVGTGLLLGKTAGIFSFAWLSVRTRIANLPTGVTFGHVLGISALGGVGFTVSLFVARLAFEDPGLFADAKVGIFAGSLLAAVLGFTILRYTTRER